MGIDWTDVTLDESIDYDWIKPNISSQILFAKTFVIHKQNIHIEEIDELLNGNKCYQNEIFIGWNG